MNIPNHRRHFFEAVGAGGDWRRKRGENATSGINFALAERPIIAKPPTNFDVDWG